MFLTNETLQAICRTFLHSIWQGMIAAALAGVILWGTRHSSARTRYNLLGLLLLLSLLISGITFYAELGSTATAIADISGTDMNAVAISLPQHPGQLIITYMNQHAPWFMLAWALIFLVKCFRLMSGFYYIHRIRRTNIHPVQNHWEETLIKLSHALGIQKAVRLLESGIVKTPVTIGFFKPVIFLPLGLLTQLPADQVETILLHELAHIRRKDYLVNVLHSFTETIFFFNPAFLWISARLREEREACCDDIVVAHTPHKATYLHALVAFEAQTAAGTSLQLRMGSTQGHLLHRVKRLLTRENKKLTIMERISLIFGLIAITAFSFMPEKESEKPAAVSPHSAESLVYYVPVPVQEADTTRVKKDKWVTLPDTPKKRTVQTADARKLKKDKWVLVQDTVVQFAKPKLKKDRFVTVTDTVQFSKPVPKKKKVSSTDTVYFKKPALKKEKTATETSSLPLKKKWIEAPPEREMGKKKLFAKAETALSAGGDQTFINKKVPPALKPADKDIKKKKKEETQLRSKFFGDYLPDGIREKVNPKQPNC